MINFMKKIIYTKKYQLKLFLLKNNQKFQKKYDYSVNISSQFEKNH